jgi:alkanesulfonate monooxygenase SsuD/methylene tetrahydromethanopterin reductase-like flavin-dependent oxidoreductase (luciferase family)
MSLTFGLALQNDFPPPISPSTRIGELREQVRAARGAGISSVWTLNHFLGNMQTLQPLTTLAALAEHAGDMRLGTNMFILPLRHPVGVAEEFATLDQITGGRAIAGFGLGYRGNEYDAFGISMDDRVARYEESVAVLRGLWSGQPFTFEGEHFTIRDQRIGIPPVQPGGPPIWVGAGVHKAGARRAARLGDAWIVPPHAEPEKLRTILGYYRSGGARPRRSWPAASWSSTTTPTGPAPSACTRGARTPGCTRSSRRPTRPTATVTSPGPPAWPTRPTSPTCSPTRPRRWRRSRSSRGSASAT